MLSPGVQPLWAAPQCRGEVASWLHAEWHADAGDTLEDVEARLRERDRQRRFPATFVALHGSSTVYTFTLETTPDPRSPRDLWCLSNVLVTPAWRRQGVGRYLCQSAIDWTRTWRIPRLSLFTESHADFYSRLGWRPVEVLPRDSRGRTLPALLMQCDVPA